MDYKQLLEKAKKESHHVIEVKQRFEVPKVLGKIQGNRTIISNFMQIANKLDRPPEHLLKYILKELATPGEIKKSDSVIFGTKVPASRINEKIKKYTEEFVLCQNCGKPDTKLVKEDEFTFLKCQACGSKRAVKSKL